MQLARMIQAVDLHAAGEPGRVIVGGVLDVPGGSMFDRGGFAAGSNQPKTNEERAAQMAHQSPSDSSATTMKAGLRLRRAVVRGADCRGFPAG